MKHYFRRGACVCDCGEARTQGAPAGAPAGWPEPIPANLLCAEDNLADQTRLALSEMSEDEIREQMKRVEAARERFRSDISSS